MNDKSQQKAVVAGLATMAGLSLAGRSWRDGDSLLGDSLKNAETGSLAGAVIGLLIGLARNGRDPFDDAGAAALAAGTAGWLVGLGVRPISNGYRRIRQ